MFKCKYTGDFPPPPDNNIVKVDGVRSTFYLYRDKLNEQRVDVQSMLSQLPPSFLARGEFFTHACNNATGEQWGEHIDMEMLFVLAEGLGVATKERFPVDISAFLGVPYLFKVDIFK